MQTSKTTPSSDTPTLQLQKDQITYLVGGSQGTTVGTTGPRSEVMVDGDEALETARAKARQLRDWIAKMTLAEEEWTRNQPKLVTIVENAIEDPRADHIDAIIAKTKETITKITIAIKNRKQRQEEERQRQEEERQRQEEERQRQEEERRQAEEERRKLAEERDKVQKLKEKIAKVAMAVPAFTEKLGKFGPVLDKISEQPTAAAVEKNRAGIEEKLVVVMAAIKKHKEEEARRKEEARRLEEERRKQAEQNFKVKWAKVGPAYLSAMRVPRFNDSAAKARKTLEAAYGEFAKLHTAKDFAGATEALGPLIDAIKPYSNLQKQFAAEEKEYNSGWANVEARYNLAKVVSSATPGADPLLKDMNRLLHKMRVAGTEKKFGQAKVLLDSLEKAVDRVLKQVELAKAAGIDFEKQWAPVKERCGKALALPDSTPALDPLRKTLEAAQKAVEDKAAVHDYGAAVNLLSACDEAVLAFAAAVKQLRANTTATKYAAERGKIRKDFEDALTTPPSSPEAIKLLSDLNRYLAESATAVSQNAFDQALEPLKDIDLAAQRLKLLKAQFEQEKPAYEKKWKTMEKEVENALRVRPATSELTDLLNILKQRNTAVLDETKAGRYGAAIGLLDPLLAAAQTLVKAAAQADLAVAPKAAEAKKAIDDLAAEGLLDAQSVERKLQLLDDLRVLATPLTDEARETQRTLYKSLRLDVAFRADDKKRREQVVKNLLPNAQAKEDLKKDKAGWPGKSDEEKLQVLRRMVAAQSKALGIEPAPPVMGITKEPSGSVIDGYFSQADGTIYMNLHAEGSLHDFDAALDTVFHENSHNYQKQLIDKLKATDLPVTDPRYLQVRMFQANLASGGYVKPAEDRETYLYQPVEDHAHVNGPKTAKAVLAELM